MAKPHALILRSPGTNCDVETAYAFEQAGATAERLHINRWLEQPDRITSAQILCIPGGFSYGDDIAAGRILAGQLRQHLANVLAELHASDTLILGICNGFQVLIQTGMLIPDNFGPTAQATLTDNDSGKFEDRWVQLGSEGNQCVFLRNIDQIYLPVAHAEGKFVARNPAVLDQLRSNGQLALRYQSTDSTNSDPSDSSRIAYPDNPNGSQENVAGLCDTTGRVLGLMPHPERFIDRVQHPRWTREVIPNDATGLRLFQNAVEYFA